MESQPVVKDQKQCTFKISEESKQRFLENCEQLSKTDENDMKNFVNSVKVQKNDYQQNIDLYDCYICEKFAHDPLVCQKCEIAVCCKECYNNWAGLNGKKQCKNCDDISVPKPLIKFLRQARDNIIVKCQNQKCKVYEKEIYFQEYYKHIDECIIKEFSCPQKCGCVIPLDKCLDHYLNCVNTYYACDKCECLSLQRDFQTHDCFTELLAKVKYQRIKQEIYWRPLEVLVCPCGHQLDEIQPNNRSNRCQQCHQSRINVQKYYRCQPCDFDLCLACSTKYLNFQKNQNKDKKFQLLHSRQLDQTKNAENYEVQLLNKQILIKNIFINQLHHKNVDQKIFKNIQFQSLILKDEDLKNELTQNIKDLKSINLLFRASEDSFDADVFHSKCDDQGSTLVIAKCQENGTVFGGFTTISWQSLEQGRIVAGNGESFIFTIKNGQDLIKLKCINKNKEIWNCKRDMPSFGGIDLRLQGYCNQQDDNFSEPGQNYELPQGIEKDSDEAFCFLTGKDQFTVDELEVFKIEHYEKQISFEEEKVSNNNQRLNSKIIQIEDQEKQLIQNLNDFVSLNLLYRGSEDSFDASAFHQKCDDKGPTLTIARNSQNGVIFGGFTPISWQSLEIGQCINGDGKSFLFNIKNRNEFIKFECLNKQREIWNFKKCMPSFGTLDLRIVSNCNEVDNNFAEIGNSYQLPNGIEKDSDESLELLTGQEAFQVDELEVYQVVY